MWCLWTLELLPDELGQYCCALVSSLIPWQLVSEPMADDLWAGSPGTLMLLALGFARRLSMQQEKSMTTLDGAKKNSWCTWQGWTTTRLLSMEYGGLRWNVCGWRKLDSMLECYRSRLRGVCMIYDKPVDNRSNSKRSKARPNVWFTHEGEIVGACVKIRVPHRIKE